jgi:hypothetical protein
MDLQISLENLKDLEKSNSLKIDAIKFQKMILLFNAIEQGWSVKKKRNSYIFVKNHEGKKEVLENSYLMKFMNSNLDLNNILL